MSEETSTEASSGSKSWKTVTAVIAIVPVLFGVWKHGEQQGERNAKAELLAQLSRLQNSLDISKENADQCDRNLKDWRTAHAKVLDANAALNQQLAANNTNTFLQNEITRLQAEINGYKHAGFSVSEPAVQVLESRLRAAFDKLQCRP